MAGRCRKIIQLLLYNDKFLRYEKHSIYTVYVYSTCLYDCEYAVYMYLVRMENRKPRKGLEKENKRD